MAAVSVFVDDAIRGELPQVCVRTGEPADLTVRMQRPVGGVNGLVWLLVFLGPPGWVALLILLLVGPGQETLTIRVPYLRTAFDADRRKRRLRTLAAAVGLVFLMLAAAQVGALPQFWLVLAGLGLAAALALQVVVSLDAVDVSLDASRRWVTLTGVHPAFVRAVEQQEAATLRR